MSSRKRGNDRGVYIISVAAELAAPRRIALSILEQPPPRPFDAPTEIHGHDLDPVLGVERIEPLPGLGVQIWMKRSGRVCSEAVIALMSIEVLCTARHSRRQGDAYITGAEFLADGGYSIKGK